MSEHRARADHKRVGPSDVRKVVPVERSRHGAPRSRRGRYLGVGTGLAAGLTGMMFQMDLGSSAAGASVRTADTWSQLAGALTEGTAARTVTMGADIVAPLGAPPLTVPAGESLVLDLNGHKLAIAPGGILLGHGAGLQVEDGTAGADRSGDNGGAPASPRVPALGGYDGNGGLAATARPSAESSTVAGPRSFIGPLVPAFPSPSASTDSTPGAVSSATAPAVTAATEAAAARSASVDHAAGSRPAAHKAAAAVKKSQRPRGRHRRQEGGRHRMERRDWAEHWDCEEPRGHWVEEYEWWEWSSDAA